VPWQKIRWFPFLFPHTFLKKIFAVMINPFLGASSTADMTLRKNWN